MEKARHFALNAAKFRHKKIAAKRMILRSIIRKREILAAPARHGPTLKSGSAIWNAGQGIDNDVPTPEMRGSGRSQRSRCASAGPLPLDLVRPLLEKSPNSLPVLKQQLQLLVSAARYDEVTGIRERLLDVGWDDSTLLNEIAWNIAIGEDPRDLSLARRAALRASDMKNHHDGAILDTVARVFYEQGELDKAIEWQRKAAKHAPEIREVQKTLDKYLAEKEAATDRE